MPATAARYTAQEVLDYHVSLHDRLAHPSQTLKLYYASQVKSILQTPGEGDTFAMFRFYPYGKRATDPGIAGQYITSLALDLFSARTYQVTPEMVRLANQLMPSITSDSTTTGLCTLEEEELPHPWGFIWLDNPWEHPDRNSKTVAIRAISWGTVKNINYHDGQKSGTANGLRVACWTLYNDPDDYLDERSDTKDMILSTAGPLDVIHTETIPFVREYTHPLIHMLHTLFMLIDMEITESHPADIQRAARRRAQRSIRQSEVLVVRLRRPHHEPTGAHKHVDWSCTWIVRGHKRRAPHGGTFKDGSMTTWVKPHLKGPDGAPLKASDVLYRLER